MLLALQILVNLRGGATPPTPDVVPSGAARGSGKKRKSGVWLEENGKILIFQNATEAAKYVKAQKDEKRPDKPKKDKKKAVRLGKAPIVIDPNELKGFEPRLRLESDISLDAALRMKDIETLIRFVLAIKDMQEEDDIEVVLLLT